MDLSLRAILFTDLEGSTALAAQLGDPVSRDLIRTEYERVCDETIGKYGGHVFKRLGDGILADFGSARRAVWCATEIHQRLAAGDSGLRARIAVTIGEPVEEAGDFFGSAVNAAQRAASIGHGGETVVSAAVPEVVGAMQAIKFVQLAPKRLKGLPAARRLFVVADAAAPLPRAAALSLRSWPRVRWLALTGTLIFAALVIVSVSIANAPPRPSLVDPTGIAVDPSGVAYVVSHDQILKVNKGLISVFAGTGSKGFAGDGGPARLSDLSGPDAVAVAPNGDVFIADTGNDRVRVVRNGRISTVIGDGQPGYGGDGGQATSAHITAPEGVSADSQGDVYIADNGNNVVRKVDSRGIITTVAGGSTGSPYVDSASAVTVDLGCSPLGIVANEAGEFWFTCDQAVYHVGTDGRIHRIGGGKSPGYEGDGGPANLALLRDPQGIAVHGTDVFVADTDNERVRKIDQSGVIVTVAGNGLKGYSGDNGEATSAELTTPGDVGVDSSGRLFIADTGNNHIRVITAGGLISTVV